jgi:hypothetical protein
LEHYWQREEKAGQGPSEHAVGKRNNWHLGTSKNVSESKERIHYTYIVFSSWRSLEKHIMNHFLTSDTQTGCINHTSSMATTTEYRGQKDQGAVSGA